jgi:PDZ domain
MVFHNPRVLVSCSNAFTNYLEENSMSPQRFSSPMVRCFFTLLAVSVISLASSAPWCVSADERGTIGITFQQLFSEAQPNHRGPLVVLNVADDSPAATAGIHCSDFVIAVNGVPVPGREFSDIVRKDLHGSIGDIVRLTILRYDGSQSEIAVVRAPYPLHVNPASDPFGYSVPGSWSTDPRYPFPLPWSPTLAYHGFEDLFYVPNFDQTDSPEYHSYLFFLSLEGTPAISAGQLQSDMVVYFRGLAEERGRRYAFTPDLSKVSATYKEDVGASRKFGGAAARTFSGTVSIWDTHGKVITLNSEVVAATCPGSDHTVLFFAMSLEPRDGDIWKQLDAVRDTFQCNR